MTTIMRSAAVAAVGLFVAFSTVGCDDVSSGDGDGTTTTIVGPTTTSTTGSTVSSTTTTLQTTTTTIGGGVPHLECAITFGVTNTATFGALQVNVDYNAAQGEFEGSADQVVCTDLTGSLSSFNDNDGTRVLSAGMISIAGFTGPRDVFRCNFNTPNGDITDPVAGDFAVTVVDATDPALNPIPGTAVTPNDITCVQVGGGTTTTTIGGTTVTTTGPTTTTTTGGGGTVFDIAFNLVEAVNIGALQFSVNYSAAGGGFDGAADTVQCTDSTGSLASFNDNEGTTTLSAGFINLGGFTGPRLVATCNFTSTGGTPTPANFVVTVEDAAQPDLTPITPLPTINVTVTPG